MVDAVTEDCEELLMMSSHTASAVAPMPPVLETCLTVADDPAIVPAPQVPLATLPVVHMTISPACVVEKADEVIVVAPDVSTAPVEVFKVEKIGLWE